VEVPLGDFFGLGWDECATLSSKFVVWAGYCALNSYSPMRFRTAAKVALENVLETDAVIYYYLDYAVGPIPDDLMYFHGTWRRSDPVQGGMHEMLDIRGRVSTS